MNTAKRRKGTKNLAWLKTWRLFAQAAIVGQMSQKLPNTKTVARLAAQVADDMMEELDARKHQEGQFGTQ